MIRDLHKHHGHVTPRRDGYKARCAGPGLCRVCNAELAEKARAEPPPADRSSDLKADLERLEALAERLKAGIQAYLDGDYPNPRQYRPGNCPHGISHRQACEVCIDNHFQKLLEDPQ